MSIEEDQQLGDKNAPMYNASYHPLEGERLHDLLRDLSAEEKKIALPQIVNATENKIRNYLITIVPPTRDDKQDGTWFFISNGILSGSCLEGRTR